jgi:FecR protein
MTDDYLWDGSGEPDPEVERLERLLGEFRSSRPAPELPSGALEHHAPELDDSTFEQPRRPLQILPRLKKRYLPWIGIAAAAAIALALAGNWLGQRSDKGAWDVVALAGVPKVGSAPIRESGRLEVGDWLETDASSRAKINVGDIGEAEIEPNSRVRLLQARADEHRLGLVRGTMRALIYAPKRLFFVDTPSAVAVDLGCTYTLQVDDSGASLLHVTSGLVAFEFRGRESFVPTDAFCVTRPGIGPGTPYYSTASEAFRTALTRLDFELKDPVQRAPILELLFAESRRDDAFTLWHLLGRVSDAELSRVYDRLSAYVPPPAGVTRAGVERRNKEMLDLWWNELGPENAYWYRFWKGSAK